MERRKTAETEYQMLTKNNEGEAEIHDLLATRYAYDDDKEPFSPATPARITPSRKKGVQRDHELLVQISDAQIDYRRIEDELIPIHNETAMRCARYLIRDLMPDTIINLGDNVDLAALSKFSPDSDHFHRTLGPAFQRAHDFYAELRADNPNSLIVEVDSNHNERLKKFVLKNFPEFYDFRRASESDEYPMMTYPYLANLQHLDVQWISGYGAAEYVRNNIAYRHGKENSSPTSAAANKILRNNPDITSIQGHDHRKSEAWRTTRNGRYIGAIVVPALCKTEGEVPGYHSAVDDLNQPVKKQQDWQNGIHITRDYGDHQEHQTVFIRNGKATYQGEEYDGNN